LPELLTLRKIYLNLAILPLEGYLFWFWSLSFCLNLDFDLNQNLQTRIWNCIPPSNLFKCFIIYHLYSSSKVIRYSTYENKHYSFNFQIPFWPHYLNISLILHYHWASAMTLLKIFVWKIKSNLLFRENYTLPSILCIFLYWLC